MISEIWKSIDGYEGLYEVSNLGRVKSLNYNHTHTEKILKPGKYDKLGHLFVNLCKNGETKHASVHRLVGKAFVEGWFEGAVINHKDHQPSNNIAANLEWTTQKQNTSREKSFAAELFSKKVYQYTKSGDFVREWPSTMEIKRQTGFNRCNICECCNGKRKSANGFVWKYKEAA